MEVRKAVADDIYSRCSREVFRGVSQGGDAENCLSCVAVPTCPTRPHCGNLNRSRARLLRDYTSQNQPTRAAQGRTGQTGLLGPESLPLRSARLGQAERDGKLIVLAPKHHMENACDISDYCISISRLSLHTLMLSYTDYNQPCKVE